MSNQIYTESQLADKIAALRRQGRDVIFERPANPYWWTHFGYQDFAKKMAFENYTEVVDAYRIYGRIAMPEKETYYEVHHCGHALHVIGTDNYFLIQPAYGKKGKYVLYDAENEGKETRYFKTELQEPNAIGEPSVKKISAWVDYLLRKREEITAYVVKNETNADRQQTALLHNYPDAIVRRDLQGVIREIRFREGNLEYTYERSETGFTRKYEIVYNSIPSFAEQTTPRTEKDTEKDTIDACISILEEVTKKDSVSDIPHYVLDDTICKVYEILTNYRK